MSTITQVQCDIDTCTDTAAFTGVETTVKVTQTSGLSPYLDKANLDLCSKHKQELMNLTPIVTSGDKLFKFAHTNATR